MDENKIIVPAYSELKDEDLGQVSGGMSMEGGLNTFIIVQNLTTAILANFDIKSIADIARYRKVNEVMNSWIDAKSTDKNVYAKYAAAYNKKHNTNWMTETHAELILSLEDEDALRSTFIMDDKTLRETFLSVVG